MSAQPNEITVLDSMPPSQAMAVHANPYLGMIENVLARGGDLAQVDKLLDLQIKWEANEARKAYVDAMAAFKAEPMVIGKNKHVEFNTSKGVTAYDHAELADVTDVVVPRLAKHGFSHAWTPKQEAGKITVACVLTHRLGHSERVELTAPADDSGGKNTIQAIASTNTYLQRYTLLSACGLATGGQDNDGRGYVEPEPVDQKAADWIKQAKQLQGAEDYAPLKSKMLKDYGSVISAVPKTVRDAFSEAKARVTPKDESK